MMFCLKRLLAFFYDSLMVVTILGICTMPWLAVFGADFHQQAHLKLMYQLWLLLIVMAYFVVSWHRGGQTIGLKAVKLEIRDVHWQYPGWCDASLRFFGLILVVTSLGLLALLCLFHQRHLADQLSRTYTTPVETPDPHC